MPTTIGRPEQIDRLNNRPLEGDEIEDTRSAEEKYSEWAKGVAAKLGTSDMRADVPNDNAALVAALAKIAADGAPSPIRVKNIVSYPANPALSFTNETLVFTHFQNPRLHLSCGETWLALNPDIVIADLRAAGIRAKQD